MKPYVSKLFHGPATANLSSSNVSIGIASTFVLATAALSLVVDGSAPAASFGGDWVLRGALAPAEPAPTGASAHVAAPKKRQLG